jgi:outer membrane murein-binding lipoprotein Lpp
MEALTITAAISAAAAISGIVLGWLGRSRAIRQDGAADGELRASVEYIARGVDDLRVEIRSQGQRYDMLAERVTRVEESAKQAHKRIDRLEDDVK